MCEILVVDDTGDIYRYCEAYIASQGYKFIWAKNGKDALNCLSRNVSLVLLDKNFSELPEEEVLSNNPEEEGLFILREIRKRSSVPVIMLTAFADAASVVDALRNGANDYIEWSVLVKDEFVLLSKIKHLLTLSQREEEVLIQKYKAHGLVGQSNAMLELFKELDKAANSNLPVLLVGETGTGKEVAARAIHKESKRKGAFVPINISALPKELVESELFGYKKGAFTGAFSDKLGLFEVAHCGTLFLDEVGDLPYDLQIKLLRVIEEREFFPLGGRKPVRVNVRIIAATNKNLEDLVIKKEFRSDLYYRLRVFTINIPPLRERREDIPLLVDHFIDLFTRTKGFRVWQISDEAMSYLLSLHWSGNVRELENTILCAMAHADRVITLKDIIKAISWKDNLEDTITDFSYFVSNHTFKEIEKQIYLEVLKTKGWDIKKTAESLGVSIPTVYNKIKKYKIEIPK